MSDMSTPLAGGGGPSAAALGPASVLLLASIFELAASASLCASDGCGGSRPYGLACGAVSVAGSVLLLAQTLALPLPVTLPPTLPATMTLLLLAWWCAGCLVLTFIGPFTRLGNGHLSTWGALLASAATALPHHPALAAAVDRFSRLARGELGLVAMLGLCSAVAAVQAGCCYFFSSGSPVDVWVLLVGAGSAAACAGLVWSPQLVAQHARPVAAGLLGWWFQGLVVTFVRNDFSESLNGFLSTWSCIVLSGVLWSSASGSGLSPSVLAGLGAAAAPQPYSLAPASDTSGGGAGYVGYGGGGRGGVGGAFTLGDDGRGAPTAEAADAYFAAGGE